MPRQFILNPDGSAPANVNVDLLAAQGIPLVMPTPMPEVAGMLAVEQDPQQDAAGVWRQAWALVPAPDADPAQE